MGYQRRVHGDLRLIIQAKAIMGAAYLVAILAIATTCNGASIQKREANVGRLDRSLDLFGIRLGIQYKDPSDRTKGGKLDFAIDDMKAYFPRAHGSAIELNLNFDGGDNNRDGLFTFSINYKLTHGDGDGDETGTATIGRTREGPRWVTTIKTQTTGSLNGPRIIPARISNLDFSMSSDRQTAFELRYLNPSAGRDLKIVANRVPGKSAHIVIDRDGATVQDLTFSAKDFDLKNIDGNFEIGVSGTSRGLPLKGSIKGEANAKGNRVKVEFERGNKKVVQIDSKIKKNIPKLYFETMTKYSLLGGAVQGQIKMKFEDGQLNLKNEAAGETIELRVKIVPGQSADIECKKNGESMWSYKTERTTVNTPEKFEMDLVTDLTLNSKSMVWAFLDKNYPYGAFNVRKNTLKVFVDRQNYNKFLPKFFIDLKLFKEGAQVVDLTIDSRNKPYKFLFVAPNVFARWNIPYDKIEATLAHDIGSSIVFNTNIGGGIDIEANRAMNAKGGRDIHILTKKAGKQMMKVDIHTEKEINDDHILIKLNDAIEIDNDSALYRRLVGNRLLKGGGGSSGGHLLLEVEGNIAELLLDVTDDLTLGGGGERVASLGEDLHQVVGELTSSKVKTDDGVGESITLVDGDTVGNTITGVHDNTSGTSGSVQGEDSLDGDVHGGHVEGLEHDLGHLLTVGLGVEGSLSQEDGLFLGGNTELVVEGVMPDLLHVIPVGDDSVLNGVLQGEDTSLGLGLISNIGILLSHTDHDSLVAGTADNGGEDSSGSVISSESSLAHAGAIVNNQSSNVFVTHLD